MVVKHIGRGLACTGAILSILLILMSGVSPAAAEKGTPPIETPLPGDANGEVPELVGYEVWVDVSVPEQDSQPKGMPESFSPSLLAPSTTVVINEFDQYNDDIEFHNLSTGAVDMSGWQVTIYYGANIVGNTYTFPAGFVLGAGAYVVLHENGIPAENTAADLFAGENFTLQALGGAISLVDDTAAGVDFVRWNVGMVTPPVGTGWVGENPFLPENVYFSLGRNAASLDRDYGEDWSLQMPSYGVQNDPDAPLCVQLWLVNSGGGSTPSYTPSQSAGCPIGYFVPGEVVLLIADPDPGWEVGQWGEVPATEYLGTELVLAYTMTMDHSYLWLSYIESSPDPGSVLLMGTWGDYSYTLDDMGVPYDQINNHQFAPDWAVLSRYDMVIYQGFEGEPFYVNLRGSNFATYLDEGGCMWVEADNYDPEPDAYAPDVPYYYFGIYGFGANYLADTITGTGTLFSGLGPYDDPDDEYYADLAPYNGAEVAFEDISGNDVGVSKIGANYTTALISYDFNNLTQLEQAEILATFLDACSIPHNGYEFPTNDDFDTPIVIPGLDYTNTQGALSIMQATTAGDDPVLEDPNKYYHTVWYSYTAAASENITVDTFGSDYDTVLGVWTGTRGSLTEVVVNDDFNYPDVVQSRAVFSAVAGTTYYIEIASWTSDYGNLVLNVSGPGGYIFESDFEEGNLLEWTRYNDGGGWLYACPEAAINGDWGACVASGDNDKRKQLIDETPVSQTSFSARFSFDINSLSMGQGERFRFMQMKYYTDRAAFIVLMYNGGNYYIQMKTKLDDLTLRKTDFYLLTDAPHTIEVDWQAASGDGANDGFAELYIDNVLQEAITGIDNDTFFISSFRMGFTSRLDGKIIDGIFYIDDVVTSNTGYIGPP